MQLLLRTVGGDMMSESTLTLRKVIPIIAVTWILSLITTLAVVYLAPYNFQIGTNQIVNGAVTADKIADSAINTTNLADGAVSSAKVLDGNLTAADIADGAVTSLKLTSRAIPFGYTNNPDEEATNSTTWVDMPDMSVSITLARTSHIIIMFSATAYVDDVGNSIWVRAIADEAMPDEAIPYPVEIVLTKGTQLTMGTHSFTWNLPDVSAGTHTVKIQWSVSWRTSLGNVADRSLSVIALPM
jgi:hypothetical protein